MYIVGSFSLKSNNHAYGWGHGSLVAVRGALIAPKENQLNTLYDDLR